MEDFDLMANELAKDRSVCTFDYRGMGRSGPDTEDVTFLQTATDAFQLLEELGWKEFYLIGHSFGGLVALELLLLLRGRNDFSCSGLVLLSTSAKILVHGTLSSFIYDQLRKHSIGVNGKSYNDMDRNSKIALSQGIKKACDPSISSKHFDLGRNIQIIEQQIYLHDALELVQMLHLVSETPVLSITGLKDTVNDQNYFQPIDIEFSNNKLVRLPEGSFWTWTNCFSETLNPIRNFSIMLEKARASKPNE